MGGKAKWRKLQRAVGPMPHGPQAPSKKHFKKERTKTRDAKNRRIGSTSEEDEHAETTQMRQKREGKERRDTSAETTRTGQQEREKQRRDTSSETTQQGQQREEKQRRDTSAETTQAGQKREGKQSQDISAETTQTGQQRKEKQRRDTSAETTQAGQKREGKQSQDISAEATQTGQQREEKQRRDTSSETTQAGQQREEKQRRNTFAEMTRTGQQRGEKQRRNMSAEMTQTGQQREEKQRQDMSAEITQTRQQREEKQKRDTSSKTSTNKEKASFKSCNEYQCFTTGDTSAKSNEDNIAGKEESQVQEELETAVPDSIQDQLTEEKTEKPTPRFIVADLDENTNISVVEGLQTSNNETILQEELRNATEDEYIHLDTRYDENYPLNVTDVEASVTEFSSYEEEDMKSTQDSNQSETRILDNDNPVKFFISDDSDSDTAIFVEAHTTMSHCENGQLLSVQKGQGNEDEGIDVCATNDNQNESSVEDTFEGETIEFSTEEATKPMQVVNETAEVEFEFPGHENQNTDHTPFESAVKVISEGKNIVIGVQEATEPFQTAPEIAEVSLGVPEPEYQNTDQVPFDYLQHENIINNFAYDSTANVSNTGTPVNDLTDPDLIQMTSEKESAKREMLEKVSCTDSFAIHMQSTIPAIACEQPIDQYDTGPLKLINSDMQSTIPAKACEQQIDQYDTGHLKLIKSDAATFPIEKDEQESITRATEDFVETETIYKVSFSEYVKSKTRGSLDKDTMNNKISASESSELEFMRKHSTHELKVLDLKDEDISEKDNVERESVNEFVDLNVTSMSKERNSQGDISHILEETDNFRGTGENIYSKSSVTRSSAFDSESISSAADLTTPRDETRSIGDAKTNLMAAETRASETCSTSVVTDDILGSPDWEELNLEDHKQHQCPEYPGAIGARKEREADEESLFFSLYPEYQPGDAEGYQDASQNPTEEYPRVVCFRDYTEEKENDKEQIYMANEEEEFPGIGDRRSEGTLFQFQCTFSQQEKSKRENKEITESERSTKQQSRSSNISKRQGADREISHRSPTEGGPELSENSIGRISESREFDPSSSFFITSPTDAKTTEHSISKKADNMVCTYGQTGEQINIEGGIKESISEVRHNIAQLKCSSSEASNYNNSDNIEQVYLDTSNHTDKKSYKVKDEDTYPPHTGRLTTGVVTLIQDVNEKQASEQTRKSDITASNTGEKVNRKYVRIMEPSDSTDMTKIEDKREVFNIETFSTEISPDSVNLRNKQDSNDYQESKEDEDDTKVGKRKVYEKEKENMEKKLNQTEINNKKAKLFDNFSQEGALSVSVFALDMVNENGKGKEFNDTEVNKKRDEMLLKTPNEKSWTKTDIDKKSEHQFHPFKEGPMTSTKVDDSEKNESNCKEWEDVSYSIPQDKQHDKEQNMGTTSTEASTSYISFQTGGQISDNTSMENCEKKRKAKKDETKLRKKRIEKSKSFTYEEKNKEEDLNSRRDTDGKKESKKKRQRRRTKSQEDGTEIQAAIMNIEDAQWSGKLKPEYVPLPPDNDENEEPKRENDHDNILKYQEIVIPKVQTQLEGDPEEMATSIKKRKNSRSGKEKKHTRKNQEDYPRSEHKRHSKTRKEKSHDSRYEKTHNSRYENSHDSRYEKPHGSGYDKPHDSRSEKPHDSWYEKPHDVRHKKRHDSRYEKQDKENLEKDDKKAVLQKCQSYSREISDDKNVVDDYFITKNANWSSPLSQTKGNNEETSSEYKIEGKSLDILQIKDMSNKSDRSSLKTLSESLDVNADKTVPEISMKENYAETEKCVLTAEAGEDASIPSPKGKIHLPSTDEQVMSEPLPIPQVYTSLSVYGSDPTLHFEKKKSSRSPIQESEFSLGTSKLSPLSPENTNNAIITSEIIPASVTINSDQVSETFSPVVPQITFTFPEGISMPASPVPRRPPQYIEYKPVTSTWVVDQPLWYPAVPLSPLKELHFPLGITPPKSPLSIKLQKSQETGCKAPTFEPEVLSEYGQQDNTENARESPTSPILQELTKPPLKSRLRIRIPKLAQFAFQAPEASPELVKPDSPLKILEFPEGIEKPASPIIHKKQQSILMLQSQSDFDTLTPDSTKKDLPMKKPARPLSPLKTITFPEGISKPLSPPSLKIIGPIYKANESSRQIPLPMRLLTPNDDKATEDELEKEINSETSDSTTITTNATKREMLISLTFPEGVSIPDSPPPQKTNFPKEPFHPMPKSKRPNLGSYELMTPSSPTGKQNLPTTVLFNTVSAADKLSSPSGDASKSVSLLGESPSPYSPPCKSPTVKQDSLESNDTFQCSVPNDFSESEQECEELISCQLIKLPGHATVTAIPFSPTNERPQFQKTCSTNIALPDQTSRLNQFECPEEVSKENLFLPLQRTPVIRTNESNLQKSDQQELVPLSNANSDATTKPDSPKPLSFTLPHKQEVNTEECKISNPPMLQIPKIYAKESGHITVDTSEHPPTSLQVSTTTVNSKTKHSSEFPGNSASSESSVSESCKGSPNRPTSPGFTDRSSNRYPPVITNPNLPCPHLPIPELQDTPNTQAILSTTNINSAKEKTLPQKGTNPSSSYTEKDYSPNRASRTSLTSNSPTHLFKTRLDIENPKIKSDSAGLFPRRKTGNARSSISQTQTACSEAPKPFTTSSGESTSDEITGTVAKTPYQQQSSNEKKNEWKHNKFSTPMGPTSTTSPFPSRLTNNDVQPIYRKKLHPSPDTSESNCKAAHSKNEGSGSPHGGAEGLSRKPRRKKRR
ncbi:hypothetical protein SK128_020640 [Halocaridina rubra]|uniref:Uncharacterized protein n=1 Tax=Halocaridina rubra TaxID=373956 RepID=A0AAN8WM92_HALRR